MGNNNFFTGLDHLPVDIWYFGRTGLGGGSLNSPVMSIQFHPVALLLLKYSRGQVPYAPVCYWSLVLVKLVAERHRLEMLHFLPTHCRQADDTGREDVLRFVPPEEISNGKQRNIAQRHTFELRERKVIGSKHYTSCDEPKHLGQRDKLGDTVGFALVLDLIYR